MSSSTGPVTVVAGNHAVTKEIFGEIPRHHRVELRFADLTDPEDVLAATAGAQAIVVDDEPLTAAHIDAMAPSVRVIGKLGTGFDTVDVEAARGRGLAVIYLPGSAVDEVADHTVALILASVRGLRDADRIAREEWNDWRKIGRLRTMRECTVGIVGLGRIGKAVFERLRPFGCQLLAFDPAVESDPEGGTVVGGLEDLLRAADVVALQVPLSPATTALIGRAELALMKPDAVIVNTSRGGVIDQAALVEALAGGQIGGAALDVIAAEPPDRGDPILGAPGTLLSPHVAWYSQGAEGRMRDHLLQAVGDFIRGEAASVGSLLT